MLIGSKTIIGSTTVIGGTTTARSTAKAGNSVARFITLSFALVCFAGVSACSPTVRVEPSDKPITINLNVKIEHEIRVKVDKELDSVLSEDSGLF